RKVGHRPIDASARSYAAGSDAGAVSRAGLCGASATQPWTASINAKPTTYAIATCQPPRSHANTDFASGKRFVSATPADEPNQIIEPPKPTANAMYPQS